MRWGLVATMLLAACLAGCASRGRPTAPTSGTDSQDPRIGQIEELDREIGENRKRMGLDPPDPSWTQATSTTCVDMCKYADAICRAQEEICLLADELADDWARGKCDRAKTSCQEARKRCEECRP